MAAPLTIFDAIKGTLTGAFDAINVQPTNSLVSSAYDFVAATYPSTTQEVYAFKSGGSSGTLVATITINYTDASKASILNVTRT